MDGFENVSPFKYGVILGIGMLTFIWPMGLASRPLEEAERSPQHFDLSAEDPEAGFEKE